jgi:ribonuclease BN (tRNA processing enzyme)
MDIFVLGSGAAVLPGHRFFTSILVRSGDTNVLIDAGSPIFKRLYELGIEKLLPHYVFLSHYHIDHVEGIFTYLYDLEARGIKNTPIILTNESTASKLKVALGVFVKPSLHPEIIVFKDKSEEEIRINHLEIRFIPVRHSVPTHGIVIKDVSVDKSIFYSSDTLYMQELSSYIDKCDVGFHEATIPVELEEKAVEYGYHSSPRQALLALSKCKRKILIHLTTLSFKNPIGYKDYIAAEDGLVFKI